MPLNAGARLGPYEIVSPIGAGGMGEVYRAQDTRLERTVAIKVLAGSLAADPDLRARFEREARAISQLTHPNICTLYDVGSQDGVEFLVMEYLEGETLADRLAGTKRAGATTPGDASMRSVAPASGAARPLKLEDALAISLQMADALDKAHRRGIIHRDLKPGNVMLVRGGGSAAIPTAKLLDFGLAKLGAAPPQSITETRLATTPPRSAEAPLTSRGTILGTFQYMAPEQIEGQEADARTDIWAFGCVLYEILTGRRAFEGKTQTSLIGAILERQPTPVAELQPLTPPALSRIVRTCLAKDPDDRFQTAHDLWLQLQWIEEGGSAAGLPAPVVASRKRRERALWAAGALVVAAAAGTAAWALKPAPEVRGVVSRFEFTLPEGQSLTRTGRHSLAISPNGTRIIYVANNQLYLRALDQLDAQPIRGTANEDPIEPVFSPDGERVAYWSGANAAALRIVAVAGGAPVTLCPASPSLPLGATWRHGLIAFGKGSEIQAVAEDGCTPRTIAAVDPKEGRAGQPQLLDDGTHVVFTVFRTTASTEDEGEIVVQSIGGNDRRPLVKGGTNGQVLPGGQLVYIHANMLLAVPMDMRRLTVTGGPVPVVEGVAEALPSGAGQYAVAANGTLAYRPGKDDGTRTLVWVDRQGKEQLIPGVKPRAYGLPRLSRDDSRVAVASLDDESDVWIWDFGKERLERLTSGPAVEYSVAWRPDGRQVFFRSSEAGKADIFRRSADGSGQVEPVTKDGTGGEVDSVSADGKSLVFKSTGKASLMLLPLDGGPATPLLKDPAFNFLNGEISPDGRWIAYESNEGGQLNDIYVRPFPAVNTGRSLVSVNGGTMPLWSRSGRELFYRSWSPTAGPKMMAVSISPGASFTYGKPQELFDMTQFNGPSERIFDVAADGRFLIVKPQTNTTGNRQTFVVVSHWFDDVRARIPGAK